MKQLFDISEKLITEQSDEICGWVQLTGKTLHGSICLWLVMNKSSVSCTHVFSDSVLCLGKVNENPHSNIAWEDRLKWFKSSPEYKTLDRIDGEPVEFEWNIFSGFNTLQLSQEVKRLLLRLAETPENFKGRIIFMSMFNDISWWSKDNKKECESSAQLVSLYAKRCSAGQWSFLGPGSEKKWYSFSEDSLQGEWDKMAEKMMVTLAESGHPVFRATSPLSRGVLKSKGGGKLSIQYCADFETIETVFRTTLSVNQSRKLVFTQQSQKDTENELKSYHNKTEWANFVLMQASWLQVKSDRHSWRKTLKNSHNSQIQWLVLSTLCQETKV